MTQARLVNWRGRQASYGRPKPEQNVSNFSGGTHVYTCCTRTTHAACRFVINERYGPSCSWFASQEWSRSGFSYRARRISAERPLRAAVSLHPIGVERLYADSAIYVMDTLRQMSGTRPSAILPLATATNFPAMGRGTSRIFHSFASHQRLTLRRKVDWVV